MVNTSSLRKSLFIVIVAFIISVIGATYAYFAVSNSTNNSISGQAAIISMNLSVSKIVPADTSGGMVPQFSGNPLQLAIRQGCIDDNNNTICQVYSISVRNNGESAVEVDGKISFFSDDQLTTDVSTSMPNLKWMLISSIDENDIEHTVLGNGTINAGNATSSDFASNVNLGSNASRTYYVVVWVNETDSAQSDYGVTFYGKVDFISSNGNGVTATFVEN